MREYAMIFEVNPNTMQRALGELEDQALIVTERTTGKFVTENTDIIDLFRNHYAEEITKNLFSKLEEIGLSKSAIIKIIKEQ